MTDSPDEDALTLSIVSTLDDHVALALHVANQPPFSTIRRRFEVGMLLVVPAIMTIVFLLSWALDRDRPAFGELMDKVWIDRLFVLAAVCGGFACMGLCILGSRLTRRWWIKINLRRLLKARPDVDPNDPKLSYRAQVTFDRDGVGFASATGSSRVHWAAITQLDETADYFFLIGPSLAAFSLAKRAMTAKQAIQFRHLVAEHAPHAMQRPSS